MIRRNLILFLITLGACAGFSFIAIKMSNSSQSTEIHKINEPILDAPMNIARVGVSNAIQVVLLLDTSSSMNGLIEQAKSQLWNILNELAGMNKNNQDSELQIALYEYGNPGTADSKHQIHQLSEFTTDMDLISEKLFSLSTNGGEEYCGAVIKRSLDDLTWNGNDGLKIIYIAGNEPFDQGPVSYQQVCKKAKANGVVVNTIFCGDQGSFEAKEWRLGASSGGGEFICISQNDETVYISTPYDDKINALNNKLNDTYIPYGEKGNAKKSNQVRQDMNAASYSKSNAADRISYKSSSKYKAEDWDLVDAFKKDKSILKKADIKSEEYSEMTIEELESNIQLVIEERESLQAEIKELGKMRRTYKDAEAKKKLNGKDDSLQKSIIQSIRKQAEKKGYTIKK